VYFGGMIDMPPRASILLSTSSDVRTAILQGLLIGSIIIAGLSFGREVLLPLALAILLSFVLTPPLLVLRRIRLPRVVAVAVVVGAAFAIIFALGWLISREVTQLAADLPTYRSTLSEKIKSVRENMARSPTLERAGEVLSELQKELATPETEPPANPRVGAPAQSPADRPLQVEIQEHEPTGFELFQEIAGTVLPPLATAGIVLLFVVFILLQREDLRDRLIRLFGASDLQRATTTLNDAATRLSRYFLSMTVINFSFGALSFSAISITSTLRKSRRTWTIQKIPASAPSSARAVCSRPRRARLMIRRSIPLMARSANRSSKIRVRSTPSGWRRLARSS
jgi:predicted PurR-regulated permease PerM